MAPRMLVATCKSGENLSSKHLRGLTTTGNYLVFLSVGFIYVNEKVFDLIFYSIDEL